MAAHVAADVDLDFRRRRLAIVGEEADDLFNAIERHGEPIAERDERFARQIAVAGLNLIEILNNHSMRAAGAAACSARNASRSRSTRGASAAGSKFVGESYCVGPRR